MPTFTTHPRADEARRHRRGDGGDGDRAREGARRDGRGDHRRPGAARVRARGARCPPTSPSAADASLAEARRSARSNGVEVHAEAVRARSIGHAIVDEADAPRRRPDRARLVAALAAAVAVLLADRRPRPAPRAVRGARRRVPRGRLRADVDGSATSAVKAVVIGCGRVGSAVAKQLAGEGWDVTVRRRGRGGAQRGSADWRGGFVVGHGMDIDVLDRAGRSARPTRRSSRPTATTRTSSSARSLQKRYGIGCVVVRVLDPRRARVLRRARPPHGVPDADGDLDAHRRRARLRRAPVGSRRAEPMYAIVAGGGKVGSNVTRSLLAMGHEVTLIEQRRDRFEQLEAEFGPVACSATRPRSTCSSAPGSPGRRSIVLAVTGDDEDNIVISPDRQGGLRRAEGDRARQRPAQPAALRPARDHADGLRDVGPPRRSSSTRCPSTVSCGCSSCAREGLEVVEVQVPPDSPAAGKRVAGISLPDGVAARLGDAERRRRDRDGSTR